MANNPYVNKVVKADGTTIMDISDTTAGTNDVLSGEVFYTASGARSVGSLDISSKADLAVIGEPYDPTQIYGKHEWCTHDGKLYYCIANEPFTGEWDASKWMEYTVGEKFEDLHAQLIGLVSGTTSGTRNNHVVVFNGDTGKAIKDSGFTIGTSVPANAVFTDTTYTAGTGLSLSNGEFSVKLGYMTANKKYKVEADNSGNLFVDVPWTEYTSKAAASGGTDVSLVTTGEKYTWNSKTSNTGTVTSVTMTQGAGITISDSGTAITTSGSRTVSIAGMNTSSGSTAKCLTEKGTWAAFTNNAGTVTSVATGAGLTGGTITSSGTISISGMNTSSGDTTKCLTQKGTWASFTNNAGTVTSVKMNGTSYNPSSGVVDLGTVITSHQDISGKVNKSGDTMTGSLTIQAASGSSRGLTTTVKSGDNTVGSVFFGVGSDISNHGVWSNGYYDGTSYTSSGKWMLHRAKDGAVYLDGYSVNRTLLDRNASSSCSDCNAVPLPGTYRVISSTANRPEDYAVMLDLQSNDYKGQIAVGISSGSLWWRKNRTGTWLRALSTGGGTITGSLSLTNSDATKTGIKINHNGSRGVIYFYDDAQSGSSNLYRNGTTLVCDTAFSNQGNNFTSNKGLFAGTATSTTADANLFTNGALELREAGRVGSAQSSATYAPRIGFHWSMRIAATLAMHSDGHFYFKKQNGTDNAPVHTGNVYSDNYNLETIGSKVNGIIRTIRQTSSSRKATFTLDKGHHALVGIAAGFASFFNSNGTLYNSTLPSGFTAAISNETTVTITRSSDTTFQIDGLVI